MTPLEVREKLPIYADGELPPEEHAELERLVAASADLRAEVQRWVALRRCAQRVVLRGETPSGLRSRITAQVAAARRQRIPFRVAAGLLAAAAGIAAAVFVYQRINQPDAPARNTARAGFDVYASQFAMIYRKCALERHDDRFHKHGADPNAARVELAAAEGFELLMPDLKAAGYQLAGVCPCFPEKGVRAIHAFYRKQDGDRVVSFFSIDRCVSLKQCRPGQCCKKNPNKRVYDMAIDNEVTLVKWDERGRSYAVVGRMSGDELIELATSVDVAAIESAPAYAAAGSE